MALAKISELKPNVTVWWGAGAQPPQLLSRATGASHLSGRIHAAACEGNRSLHL